MGFGDSLGKTFKSFGGAVAAPFGLVHDLAHVAFHTKRGMGSVGDFGDYLNAYAHAGSKLADPFTNGDTWTGYSVEHVGAALNTAYKAAVDRPVSTFALETSHATAQDTLAGRFGELLSPDAWGQAFQIAKNQSIGQSVVYGVAASAHDPVHGYGDPFNDARGASTPFETRLAHNPWATGSALVLDLATQWETDPTALAGKAAGAYRVNHTLGKLSQAHRDQLFESMNKDSLERTGMGLWVPKAERDANRIASRTQGYLNYINGENKTRGALSADQIFHTTPELKRAGENGRGIAAALADARDLHPDEIENAQKRILSIAGGDQAQLVRLEREHPDAQALADGLRNILKGTTLQLQVQGLNELAKFHPSLLADMQRQIDNLDSASAVTRFANHYIGQASENEVLRDVASTMHFLPGAHGAAASTSAIGKAVAKALDKTGTSLYAGDRALTAMQGKRFVDYTADAHRSVDMWARAKSLEATSTVWQKGLNQVPLVVVKTAGLPLSVYTKWPQGIVNSLRQTHYIGVANTHRWGDAITQLDSMMKLGRVDDETHAAVMAKAYSARTEPAQLGVIQRAESAAVKGAIAHHATLTGREIDGAYLDNLLQKAHHDRGEALSVVKGRTYAATEGNDGLRVDQILDESGAPLSLPVMSTQLANEIPMVDMHLINKVLGRDEHLGRLKNLSDSWRMAARDQGRLQAAITRKGVKNTDRLSKALEGSYVGSDYLLDAGQKLLRAWKTGVLFRLGYPVRVVADDQLRITAQLHNIHFYSGNFKEWAGNTRYNKIGRRADRRAALRAAHAERSALVNEYGQNALSLPDHRAAVAAAKAVAKGEDAATHEKTLARLDPEGHIREWYGRQAEIDRMSNRARGHRSRLTRLHSDAEAAGTTVDPVKVTHHEQQAADLEAGIAVKMAQQHENPDQIRARLEDLNRTIDNPDLLLPDKIKVGDKEFTLPDGTPAPGAFQGDAAHWRAASSSNETFVNQLQVDGEDGMFSRLARGAYQTFTPGDAGHLHAWQDVINHQIRNSPEAMFFVKNPTATVDDFASWIKEPEQTPLRRRVAHFAHDPEDWGGRIQSLIDDYLPDPALREKLVEKGNLSIDDLSSGQFQNPVNRPAVHGQAVDLNTGRHRAQRAFSDALTNVYQHLGELPTDALSRHPYFNAVYKKELREAYELRKAAYAREVGDTEARTYTQADLNTLSEQARRVALAEVKNLLWDVAAHTHAAHVMRFVSPFFAAHQEALTRWWRVASDDPSVVRRFQQVFDAPAQMGLVYDSNDGHLVKPGEGVSSSHMIVLRVPDAFGGKNNPIDGWLKKIGGGRYWRVNENGFNIILQNGIANPGGGPLVTVPAEALARKYANEPDIAAAARILNPYSPQGSSWTQFLPASAQRILSLKFHDKGWQAQYQNNVSDELTSWRLKHDGDFPTQAETQAIMDKAGHATTRDMLVMLAGNLTSPIPPKPESKYAAVQHGLQQLWAQADAEGKDFQWVRDSFVAKYGDVYDALIQSDAVNKAGYKGTPAEVDVTKRFRKTISAAGDFDPKLARLVIGPQAKLEAAGNPIAGKATPEARYWLQTHSLSDYSGQPFIGSKTTEETVVANELSDGWQSYSDLNNAVTVAAQQQGLTNYQQSQTLVAARKNMIAQLSTKNPVWGQAYADNAAGSGVPYSKTIQGLKEIVKDPRLTDDPIRSDIAGVRDYLNLREAVDFVLAQRKAAGLSGSADASVNRPLMQRFAQIVQQMATQSTYFDEFAYLGTIENDPYMKAGGVVPQ